MEMRFHVSAHIHLHYDKFNISTTDTAFCVSISTVHIYQFEK